MTGQSWRVLIGSLGASVAAAVGTSCGGSREAGGPGAGGGRVHLVGFDSSKVLVRGLEERRIGGLVVQDPFRMGELGVTMLVAHLEKRPVQARILTGVTLATPLNVKEPAVRSLLMPLMAGDAGGSFGATKTKQWRIAMIPKATRRDYWRTIHAGAIAAERTLGNVEVVWQGPEDEVDRFQQVQFVQAAVAAGADGIVLAPLDARAMARPVELAVSKGIPVVVIDSGLESTSPVSYISTDNHEGGVLAARRMGELLHGEGKVIVLRYAIGSESTEERERGFTETLTREFPRIAVLSDMETAGATAEEARRKVAAMLARYGGQVDGIFCTNESSTAGALAALEAAGLLAEER